MICHLQKAWEGSIWPERECRRAHQAWGVCCEEQGPSPDGCAPQRVVVRDLQRLQDGDLVGQVARHGLQ